MEGLRSRRSWLAAAVLLVALALRVGDVALTTYKPVNDARFYLRLATSVARTGDYPSSRRPGTGSGGTRGPTALFPPAFAYFLAAIDRLAGKTSSQHPDIGAARVSQAALGTITVGLVGLIALEAFGGAAALAALALAAVYPVLIETSGTLIAENLLIAFELAAVYCGLRIRRARRPYRWAVAAGILAGLATLTHQNGLVLLAPLAATAWSSLASRTSKRKALAAPATIALALLATLLPWTLRNASDLHAFIPISDQAGETLLGTYNHTSAADRLLPYRWLAPYRISGARHLNREAPQLREPTWEAKLLSRAVAYIKAHPLSPVAAAFHNTLRLLELEGSYAWEASTASVGLSRTAGEIGVIAFWALAVLALLGMRTSYVRSGPRWIWWVPILFALSTVWVRAETPRFRLPVDPFIVLLAGCALASLAEAPTRQRLWRRYRGDVISSDLSLR